MYMNNGDIVLVLTNFTFGLSNPDIDASERFRFSLSRKIFYYTNIVVQSVSFVSYQVNPETLDVQTFS